MTDLGSNLQAIRLRIGAAGGPQPVRLIAISKTQPAATVAALRAAGLLAFGENYVQESVEKIGQLADSGIEWHFVGPLQSNKCREVARHFDWLQSLDRAKLIIPLARERPIGRAALNLLIQVNIDDEASKSGCAPADIDVLADLIGTQPQLRLRGLMAIPAPDPDLQRRRTAFRRMKALFDRLHTRLPAIDTLSMGMSEDFELAIAEGATMVRVGSALFGPRPRQMPRSV